ncbi:hypothetical protein KIW84_022008 [Lathyrus oleraceus]|uniref:Uncharacterized protein n=1 Tax=Pisum sativum TaxID=3888 RepID=A0A9D5BA66_PEA|nr:hypothetical protein KIW84_022008 [Pisum sativum]
MNTNQGSLNEGITFMVVFFGQKVLHLSQSPYSTRSSPRFGRIWKIGEFYHLDFNPSSQHNTTAQAINYNVLVECEGFAFFSDIEYGNLLEFCTHCKRTGHDVQTCKFLRKINSQPVPKPKATFVPKTASNPQVEPLFPVGDEEAHPIQHNPPNFVSQPSVEYGSQLDVFMDATEEERGTEVYIAYIIFLNNSWANLVEQEEETIQHDGVFNTVISKLKKKQSAR